MDAAETRIYYTVMIETGIIVFLISFFVILMIWGYRKIMLSYKDSIFTESLVADNERARIAADLHDEMGSHLSAIKLYLECLQPYNAEQKKNIIIVGGYIDSAMNKIREISNNLTPRILQQNDFFTAARAFCETTARNARMQIRLYFDTGTVRIEKKDEIHLYRIVQEIMTNTIRHSKALRIDISMVVAKGQLTMRIFDDGCGFDSESAKNGPGSGLHNIVNRVHLLGGRIFLDTMPGEGTDYTIEIPL